jgi:hypothetical protein
MATEYPFIGKTGDQTEYVAVVRQNEIVIDACANNRRNQCCAFRWPNHAKRVL